MQLDLARSEQVCNVFSGELSAGGVIAGRDKG